jgi:nicotinamide mononucleotide transporter
MNFTEIWEQLVTGLRQTSFLEYIGVIAGIICVWFSKKENILVYPIGLINTIAYIYISAQRDIYLGEASVNIYYTIMSIYGWILWAKKDQQHQARNHSSLFE